MRRTAVLTALALRALAVVATSARSLLVEFNPDLLAGSPAARLQSRGLFLQGDGDSNATEPLATEASSVPSASGDTTVTADAGTIVSDLRPGEVVDSISSRVLTTAMTSETAATPWIFLLSDAAAARSSARELTAGVAAVSATDYGASTTTPCSDASSVQNGGSVQVLVAVSSCFDAKGWSYIRGWLATLQDQDARYFEGGTAKQINFHVKTVDDQCNKPREAEEYLNTNAKMPYVAVISIMVYTRGYNTVKQYVAANAIPNLIGFVYYEPPKCTQTLPGYTVAPQLDVPNGFLGPFNPFTISRAVYCSSMPGAVPISYVDTGGARQCVCVCPVGYEKKNGACSPVADEACSCAWKLKTGGYTFEVRQGGEASFGTATCSIKNLALTSSTGLLPVPVAVDNYVDNGRTNSGDTASVLGPSSPHIELLKQQIAVAVTQGSGAAVAEQVTTATPTLYTWKDFQSDAAAKINALEFTRVGRYSLTLAARDYSAAAPSCEACVLLVDKRRPSSHPNFPCPDRAVGDATTPLTRTSLAAAQATVSAVVAFKDKAQNDPCSPNVRCDTDAKQVKAFADTALSPATASLTGVTTFFDATAITKDLLATLGGPVFDLTKPNCIHESVATAACTRCIKLDTALKEWWTPYSCGAATAAAICDGSASATCSLTQCVTVDGSTLATTTATLKPAIKTASLAVAKGMPGGDAKTDAALTTEYKLDSSVHVALACTKFPAAGQPATDACSYKSKAKDLIDTTTASAAGSAPDALLSAADMQGFVKWRYRVDLGAWTDWGSSTVELFRQTETAITVEAWTRCGKVQTYSFRVVLHLNNAIQVCEHFNEMWYQTTAAPAMLPAVPNELCMFPKSDFAELTFDYHPNIGLNFDTDKFQMSIASVVCTLAYDASTPATIVSVDAASTPKTYQIVKQFAVHGVGVAATAAETKIEVACTFTYARRPDASTVAQSCARTFSIVDCTPPVVGKPCALDGKCDYSKCARASPADARPDLYQACAGPRVSRTSNLKTVMADNDMACCPSCTVAPYKATACTSIGDFPAGATAAFKTIKRCEAVASASMAVVMEADEMEIRGGGYASGGGMAALLVVVSAMVATVAMVAAVRRRRRGASVTIVEDAYYSMGG